MKSTLLTIVAIIGAAMAAPVAEPIEARSVIVTRGAGTV